MNDSLSGLLALYDEEAPLEYAYTIPAAWYTDQRIGRLEREQVFSNNWIAVGRIDQVANAGQFFTFELAGEPLIVVRGSPAGFFQCLPPSRGCGHHLAFWSDPAPALSLSWLDVWPGWFAQRRAGVRRCL
jgi:hypothetical protein